MLQFALSGRLAADPEHTTYGPDNTPMARLRVASNQPGAEGTDFFDVAVFGEQALAQLADAHKGDRVRLDGNARQHTWVTDDGDRRDRISLAARKVEYEPACRTPVNNPAPQHAATAHATR